MKILDSNIFETSANPFFLNVWSDTVICKETACEILGQIFVDEHENHFPFPIMGSSTYDLFDGISSDGIPDQKVLQVYQVKNPMDLEEALIELDTLGIALADNWVGGLLSLATAIRHNRLALGQTIISLYRCHGYSYEQVYFFSAHRKVENGQLIIMSSEENVDENYGYELEKGDGIVSLCL